MLNINPNVPLLASSAVSSNRATRASSSGDNTSTQVQQETWHVVEGKRGTRAWDKLLRTLDKLLDDVYQTCQMNCTMAHVDEVVATLKVSLVEFQTLREKVQEMWGEQHGGESLGYSHKNSNSVPSGTVFASSLHKFESRRSSGDSPQHLHHTQSQPALCRGSVVGARPSISSGGAVISTPWGGAQVTRRSSSDHAQKLSGGEVWPILEGSSQLRHTSSINRVPEFSCNKLPVTELPVSVNSTLVNLVDNDSSQMLPDCGSTPWKAKVDWTLMFGKPAALSLPPPLKLPLYEKLSSPGRRRSPQETKEASEERHARAGRLREALAGQRQARLARQKQKGEAAKSIQEERVEAIQSRFEEKLARSSELRQQHLAGIVQRAGEEGRKVAEVAFINQLQGEDKKLSLQQKLEEGEARRRERLGELLVRQKEASAAMEEAAGRRREAEARWREDLELKLAAKAQRKVQAQARLEGERRQAIAAREAARERQAHLVDQVAAQKQQEQAELGKKIEERLKEAVGRREHHLVLIRERAALGAQRSDPIQVRHSQSSTPTTAASRGRIPAPVTLSATALPFVPGARAPTPMDNHLLPSSASTSVLSLALRTISSSPQRSSDSSITLSCNSKGRLKGMRKRAAKLVRHMQGLRFMDPIDKKVSDVILSSPEGSSLLTKWKSLVESPNSLHELVQGVRRDLNSSEVYGLSLLHAAGPSGVLRALAEGAAEGKNSIAGECLLLLIRFLEGLDNCKYLVTAALVPGLIRAAMRELDRCNSRPQAGTSCISCSSEDAIQHEPVVVLSSEISGSKFYGDIDLQGQYYGEPLLALLLQVITVLLRKSWSIRCVSVSLHQTQKEEEQAHHGHSTEDKEGHKVLKDTSTSQGSSSYNELNHTQTLFCSYYLACGIVSRCTELLSLMDQPRSGSLTRPFPPHIIQGLLLLEELTSRDPHLSNLSLLPDRRWSPGAPNAAAISLAFQDTSMAGLPSMLTAVLLHAAPSCVPAEASPSRLPSNFVEVAKLVMRVLNNVARLDLIALQSSLSSSNLRVEFLHLIGFLLSYCNTQYSSVSCGEASIRDEATTNSSNICHLLNEVLVLVGYFSVLCPENQSMLTWGRCPSVVQSLCNLPFEYFSDKGLEKVLLPTLLSVCYGNDHISSMLSQHISVLWMQQGIQDYTIGTSDNGDEIQSENSASKPHSNLVSRVQMLIGGASESEALSATKTSILDKSQSSSRKNIDGADKAKNLQTMSIGSRFPKGELSAAKEYFSCSLQKRL